MKKNSDILYHLTPAEFETLCSSILEAMGYEAIKSIDGPYGKPIDLEASINDNLVTVAIKHTKHYPIFGLEDIITKLISTQTQISELIVMTSASWESDYAKVIEDMDAPFPIKFMDRRQLFSIIENSPKIIEKHIKPIRRSSLQQRLFLFLGIVSALFSILGLVLPSDFIFKPVKKELLGDRIESVERAINNLKDLENYLTSIKKEMTKTNEAAKIIEEKYAKAKELEKMSDAQFQAVKEALEKQSLLKTIINYILGTIFGVAASLIGAIIHTRIKHKKALTES